MSDEDDVHAANARFYGAFERLDLDAIRRLVVVETTQASRLGDLEPAAEERHPLLHALDAEPRTVAPTGPACS